MKFIQFSHALDLDVDSWPIKKRVIYLVFGFLIFSIYEKKKNTLHTMNKGPCDFLEINLLLYEMYSIASLLLLFYIL